MKSILATKVTLLASSLVPALLVASQDASTLNPSTFSTAAKGSNSTFPTTGVGVSSSSFLFTLRGTLPSQVLSTVVLSNSTAVPIIGTGAVLSQTSSTGVTYNSSTFHAIRLSSDAKTEPLSLAVTSITPTDSKIESSTASSSYWTTTPETTTSGEIASRSTTSSLTIISTTTSSVSSTDVIASSPGLVDTSGTLDGIITSTGLTNASSTAINPFLSIISPRPAISSISDGFLFPIKSTDATSTLGATTSPPAITTPPDLFSLFPSTGTEAQASASDVSIAFAGLFPLLQNWINDPQGPQKTGLISELDLALPKAVGLLNHLPKSPGPADPCKRGKRRRAEEALQGPNTSNERRFVGGLIKTAFNLVKCVVDTTNKVKEGVLKGSIDAVKGFEVDLRPLVDALKEIKPEEPEPDEPEPEQSDPKSDQRSSTQSEESSSSSSSCTLNTVSNCHIGCTAIATTTLGGAKRRADSDACTTVCEAPITKCGASGVTSASTVTSTTTTRKLCARDCPKCNAPRPPRKPITGGNFLTDANGLIYVPASTISPLTTKANVAARANAPQHTDAIGQTLYKRAFARLEDPPWNGDTEEWMIAMVNSQGSTRLDHGGLQPKGWETISLTEPLLGHMGSWHVGNLYGCSVVVVVSRKRIFMAHIFEESVMKKSNAVFQANALDVFRNPGGDGLGVTQGLTAFTGPGGDFENTPENNVRAIVFTPENVLENSNNDPDLLEYGDKVAQIKDMLRDVLGFDSSETVAVRHIAYEIRIDDEDFEMGHGKVLIQYDPAQVMEQTEGQSCATQMTALEIWFEETNNRPRYSDRWPAFPEQIRAPEPPSKRSNEGKQKWDAGENSWEEYTDILKRQAGVCSKPSGTLSPLSTSLAPTTLRTSFLPSSGDGTSTNLSSKPKGSSTTPKPQLSTNVHKPTFSQTPSPTPTPSPSLPQQKSKALSIILRFYQIEEKHWANSWAFFETKLGQKADACGSPVLDDVYTRFPNDDDGVEATEVPPWPHGTFTMKLYGEDNCQYLNDGNGAGILHCPSFGDSNNINCVEDTEKRIIGGGGLCRNPYKDFHQVAICEW
ncbi:hypothetical protein P154DRAFT_620743 [Amniculicola lignicola CBS 123094]|uniref:Uncharacterized protein n=1 Tax=Amniculicola lignicola CBS 123094 TaxID=1392246 RepID=A0A6A5WFW3_9PLEO|nr:hypothetical protein P154DRAFT_620743 [Amniculicola lignicola CBS 123094]